MSSKQFVPPGNRLTLLRRESPQAASHDQRHYQSGAEGSEAVTSFPWDEARNHLIRDRYGAFGAAYTNLIRATEIRDHPSAPRSPADRLAVRPEIYSTLLSKYCTGTVAKPLLEKLRT